MRKDENLAGDCPQSLVFCQAVGCEGPTAAVISSFRHEGWVSFCAAHTILQLAMDNGTAGN